MINAEFIKFIIINWYTGRVDFATEVYLTCCFLKKQEKEQNNTNTSFHGSKMDFWKNTKTPCCFLNDFQRMIKSDRVQQSHTECEYTWGLLVLPRGREVNQKLKKFFNFTEKTNCFCHCCKSWADPIAVELQRCKKNLKSDEREDTFPKHCCKVKLCKQHAKAHFQFCSLCKYGNSKYV